MFAECRHIMHNGRKCRGAAMRGKPFCFHHARLHFRNAVARRPRELALPGIDNVPGLQAALAKVLGALSSPLTDTRHAGVLLYGLHLAASLAKHTSMPKPRRPAKDPKSSPTVAPDRIPTSPSTSILGAPSKPRSLRLGGTRMQ